MKQRRLVFYFKWYTQLWFWIQIQYKFYSVAGHLVSKTQGQPMTVFYLKTRILMWWVSLHLYVLYTSFCIISFMNTGSQWSQSPKMFEDHQYKQFPGYLLQSKIFKLVLARFWNLKSSARLGSLDKKLGSARLAKKQARIHH